MWPHHDLHIFLWKMILLHHSDTTVCTQGLNLRRGMQSSRYCAPIPWVDHHHHHHNQPHHSNHHHLDPIMPGCTLHILLGQHCLHMVQAGESWKFQKNSHLIIITIKFTSIATQSHHHRHQSPHYRFFKWHNITKPLPQHLNHGGTSNAWKWVQPKKLIFWGTKGLNLMLFDHDRQTNSSLLYQVPHLVDQLGRLSSWSSLTSWHPHCPLTGWRQVRDILGNLGTLSLVAVWTESGFIVFLCVMEYWIFAVCIERS